MELINLFLYVSLVTFIGFNILRLVTFKRRDLYFPEEMAISFGLGIGFISLQMLLLYFLNIRFNVLAIIIPWAALPILNSILPKNVTCPEKTPRVSVRKNTGHKILNFFLAFGIIFEISYAFFRALIKPIESYDAVAIYAMKSKIFFLAKSIPAAYFRDLANIVSHPDYPLNIPLFQTFIYTALCSLNDQLVKIIFPLYFLAILALFYYAIRRFGSPTYALLFTFILASIPQFNAYAANAYLDLPLAYYCFVSALFLFRWFEDSKSTRFLLISAVMAALAGWTKNEGLMYCAVNLLLISIFLISDHKKISRREMSAFIIYTAIVAVISLPWLWLKHSHHIVNSDIGHIDITPSNILKQSHKLGPILYEFQKHLFGPKKWNIFWLAALAALILNFKRAFSGIQKYISMSLGLIVAGYIFFYIISPLDVVYFLGKTWSRFLVQFLPIAVYWLAALLEEDIKI